MATEEQLEGQRDWTTIRAPTLLLSCVGVLAMQTATAIWWASGITREVAQLRTDVATVYKRIDQVDSSVITHSEATEQSNRFETVDRMTLARLEAISTRLDALTLEVLRLARRDAERK